MRRRRLLVPASFCIIFGKAAVMSDANAANQNPLPQRGSGGRPRAFTFVQLVFASHAIVLGKVESAAPGGGLPVQFSVWRSRPQGLPARMEIGAAQGSGAQALRLPLQSALLLFLQAPGVLLGDDDVGIWPRRQADWRFTPGHVQPIDEVADVIDLLFRAKAATSWDERFLLLAQQLLTRSALGEIAAGQFAADPDCWDNGAAAVVLNSAEARLLVADAMTRRALRDPAADYALLQLWAGVPPAVAVPQLVRRLDDADAAVRDTAFASLRTATVPWTQVDQGYRPNAEPSLRRQAQQAWAQWWRSQRAARLQERIPGWLDDLASDNALRRRLGNAGLRLSTGEDMGYAEDADPLSREAAISRWQAHWQQLKSSMR